MLLFDQPAWLLLIAALPVGLYFFHGRKRRGGLLLWSYKLWQIKTYKVKLHLPRLLSAFSYIAFWLAFVLLVFVLANPVLTKTKRIYLNQGAAVMIVMDESPSMAALDAANMSRFDRAKRAIERFINSRENDVVGFITFGKEAAVRSPLTMDYDFFMSAVRNAKIMELGDGTSIGMGLALAALHLSQSSAASKNIILITDGANNSGEIHPEAALDILMSLGIKTFVAGLGHAGQTKISFEHPSTQEHITGRINDAYDETLLRHIAAQTGGLFFRAETFAMFDTVFQALDAQESGESRVKLAPYSRSFRSTLLIAAGGLVCLFLFIRAFGLKEIL